MAAGLLVTACGGGDGTDTTDAETTSEATDTSTETETESESGSEEGTAAEGDTSDWPDKIVLGLVPSQDVDELVETAKPLADLLSEELGIEVESFVPQSYTALVEAMNTGQAQIGAFGPVALVQAQDRAGAVPILQSIRFGAATYHTQWMTNDPDRFCEDEPVEETDDEGNVYLYCNGTAEAETGPVGEEALNNVEEGETIFFVDAASASGYYYPATQLANVTGLDPLSDIDGQFAGGHPNAVQAVARGDAAVAVSFDDARTQVVEEDPEIGTKAIVFAYSAEIPNDGIAVSGDLPESLQQAIEDAFLAIADSEEGAQALFDVYEIEGLQEADLEALDEARKVEENFGEE